MTHKTRLLVMLCVLLVVPLMAMQVSAQSQLPTTSANELETTGVVTAMTATTITISQGTFNIAAAEINDTITVGDVVKIHFMLAADGTFVAREVELAAPQDQDDRDDNDDGVGHDANDDRGHDVNDDRGHDANDDHRGRGGQNEDQHDNRGHNDDNGRHGGGRDH